jgi:hypothetical protein
MYLNNEETIAVVTENVQGTGDLVKLLGVIGGLWTTLSGALANIVGMFTASNFTTKVMDRLYLAKKSNQGASKQDIPQEKPDPQI